MGAINKPRREQDRALGLLPPALRTAVEGLFAGSLGRTVRCTPWRRTVAHHGEPDLYGKWRTRGRRAAGREWHWLHVLPLVGVSVPRPVILLQQGRNSLLVTEGVAGRPMDAWFVAAAAEGWLDEAFAFAITHVARLVRTLHDAGIVHRDLYWNHILCPDPRTGPVPVLIDVERVFRPRLWLRRWRVKDLAGLLSSCPVGVPPRVALRFLREWSGRAKIDPAWVTAIERKAVRIRRHTPKYG